MKMSKSVQSSKSNSSTSPSSNEILAIAESLTVASVYSVDPHVRKAEDIAAAVFRDDRDPNKIQPKRPKPKNKNTTAHFPSDRVRSDRRRLPTFGQRSNGTTRDAMDPRRSKKHVKSTNGISKRPLVNIFE